MEGVYRWKSCHLPMRTPWSYLDVYVFNPFHEKRLPLSFAD